MKEVFKVIPSFPDYEVSNFGRVKTISRKLRYVHAVTGREHFRQTTHRFLKVHYNNLTGYKFYQLYKEKKMYNKPVHQLVADAFLERKDNHDTVNHIDGNKHNNIVSNLEWCTNSYNHEHATRTGLKPKGEKVGTSKLNNTCVSAIKRMLNDGISHGVIAKWFGVSRPTISLINIGATWKNENALTGEELEFKP